LAPSDLPACLIPGEGADYQTATVQGKETILGMKSLGSHPSSGIWGRVFRFLGLGSSSVKSEELFPLLRDVPGIK